jgi:PleD family two-component response regulator
MSGKRVLSVGQCGADHSRISRTFEQAFGAEVVGVDTTLEALAKLQAEPFDLVLVNRVYDADGSPGLELIRQVKGDEALKQTPVMLVSNYDDAQREAVAAGALPGFGKASLGAPQMVNRVKGVLGKLA